MHAVDVEPGREVSALDRHLADFDVVERHAISLAIPASEAVARAVRLRAGSDALVRTLFRLRGLPGADLPLERFAVVVLGLALVERTATTVVLVGPIRGLRIGVAFEAEPRPGGGCRLATETRVANVGLAFRLYWLLVGPFSALIRRRWLRAIAASSRVPRNPGADPSVASGPAAHAPRARQDDIRYCSVILSACAAWAVGRRIRASPQRCPIPPLASPCTIPSRAGPTTHLPISSA
jgi:hypothetical protein